MAHLSDMEDVRRLTADQVQILNKDMEGFLRLANCVVESAKRVVTVPMPNKKRFWAYGELLFRWKDTYRLEADRRHLQMEMPYPSTSEEPWRPQVNGDQNLLEQLVYNLLNNAVKYSHPGTKIHIDCKRQDLSQTARICSRSPTTVLGSPTTSRTASLSCISVANRQRSKAKPVLASDFTFRARLPKLMAAESR